MRSNTLSSDDVRVIGFEREPAGVDLGIGVIFTMHHWRGVKLQSLKSLFKTTFRSIFVFFKSFGLNSSEPAAQILIFPMVSATSV